MWLLTGLCMLMGLRYYLPSLVEEYQYARTRGQQRAAYEMATVALEHSPLKGLSDVSQMVSHRVGPSVVHIYTVPDSEESADETTRLFGRFHRGLEGQGSGIVVEDTGLILTNYHVVRGSREIRVALSDGRNVSARVVGSDPLTDLAVLQVRADKLIAAQWGDSDGLEVGALVWAVGSPFGLDRSITFGILSGKHRAGQAGTHYQDFLQTDAAVNPGNSGGPLVDAQGRVVGINTAIVGDSYQGISFAIPSSVAQDVYQRLKTQRRVVRGWLGVALDVVSADRAKRLGLPEAKGAYVVSVVDDPTGPSPAKTAGVQDGDVIVGWNGQSIDDPNTLSRLVAQTEVDRAVKLVLIRDRQTLTLDVTVGERPERIGP
jgi:S1-C subfamily serine protease